EVAQVRPTYGFHATALLRTSELAPGPAQLTVRATDAWSRELQHDASVEIVANVELPTMRLPEGTFAPGKVLVVEPPAQLADAGPARRRGWLALARGAGPRDRRAAPALSARAAQRLRRDPVDAASLIVGEKEAAVGGEADVGDAALHGAALAPAGDEIGGGRR